MIRAIAVGVLCFTCLGVDSVGAGQAPAPTTPNSQASGSLPIEKPWTGDLDGIVKRRQINVERVAAQRIGREAVNVSNIYKYYVVYQLAHAGTRRGARRGNRA